MSPAGRLPPPAISPDRCIRTKALYPANSAPAVVRAINAAFAHADQIQTREGAGDTYWFAPIVADAEAGFGGPLNAFELMKWMIEAGAASSETAISTT
jgi:isocitrate lyase